MKTLLIALAALAVTTAGVVVAACIAVAKDALRADDQAPG